MPAALSACRFRSIPAAVFVMAVLFTPPAVAGDTLTVGGLTLVNKGLVGVGASRPTSATSSARLSDPAPAWLPI